jgi:hypothetical protein
MAMPFIPNTTCDIFHPGHSQGVDPPDIAGVPIYLKAYWEEGQDFGVRGHSEYGYTHKAHMDPTVDIRDIYKGGGGSGIQTDVIYVPDQFGTPFRLTFIERPTREQANNHKVAYLDRLTPHWPTNNV